MSGGRVTRSRRFVGRDLLRSELNGDPFTKGGETVWMLRVGSSSIAPAGLNTPGQVDRAIGFGGMLIMYVRNGRLRFLSGDSNSDGDTVTAMSANDSIAAPASPYATFPYPFGTYLWEGAVATDGPVRRAVRVLAADPLVPLTDAQLGVIYQGTDSAGGSVKLELIKLTAQQWLQHQGQYALVQTLSGRGPGGSDGGFQFGSAIPRSTDRTYVYVPTQDFTPEFKYIRAGQGFPRDGLTVQINGLVYQYSVFNTTNSPALGFRALGRRGPLEKIQTEVYLDGNAVTSTTPPTGSPPGRGLGAFGQVTFPPDAPDAKNDMRRYAPPQDIEVGVAIFYRQRHPDEGNAPVAVGIEPVYLSAGGSLYGGGYVSGPNDNADALLFATVAYEKKAANVTWIPSPSYPISTIDLGPTVRVHWLREG